MSESSGAEHSIQHGWYRRPIGENAYIINEMWELVLYFPDVSHALGFTLQDIADYARTVDADFAWKHNPKLPEARQDGAGWRRGEEVAREVAQLGGWLFADEAAARLELRKAKASRARHIRNQERYGRAAAKSRP